ncbi:40S ribosomal protein S3 [Bonamia ostreae]|uniref:40S ribosomal protein S3 n=1 Tax=Bonamia ostreae TaxID=126728 RepID=A0ABV2AG59_9EUKA
MKFIMMNEANGVEIDISGKLRGARGKTVKFKSGYMVKSGSAKEDFVVESIRHVNMRQGVLGIKLRIQLPSGGERGELPDVVKVKKPMELVEDEGEIEVKQPMQRKVIIPRNRRSARDIDTNPLIPQNQ